MASVADDPWVVAAGDIACNHQATHDANHCHEFETSKLFLPSGLSRLPRPDLSVHLQEENGTLAGLHLKGILALGDLQYENGELSEFTSTVHPDCRSQVPTPPPYAPPCSFDQSWMYAAAVGGVLIYPTPGNHEYADSIDACVHVTLAPACGYDDYFSGLGTNYAFVTGDGYGDYAFTLSERTSHPIRFISLNTARCDIVNRNYCRPGGRGYTFLHEELKVASTNPGDCLVVYYHEPRWSGFGVGDEAFVDDIWKLMFPQTNANNMDLDPTQQPDIVLNAHAHNYQRFDPLDQNGVTNFSTGIPEYVVGTGGLGHTPKPGPSPTHTPARYFLYRFGALRLSWSPRNGTISSAFFEEDGDQVDPPAGTRPFIYDCH